MLFIEMVVRTGKHLPEDFPLYSFVFLHFLKDSAFCGGGGV